MCCFNRPIDHVFSTRIFVGARGGQQITVYGARIYGARIEMVLRSGRAARRRWSSWT